MPKNLFSDQNSRIPNMMLSADLFSVECQKLGIHAKDQIIVYDNLGIYSSPRVWWMFQLMGHKNIAVLDGGLPAWIVAKQPTEPIPTTHSFNKGDFNAYYQENWIVHKSQVAKNLNNPHTLIIDARSKERFLSLVPEPRKNLRSGHIPKSINLPFQLFVQKGFLKSKNVLLDLIIPLDLEKKSLIFSCGSGITACIVLLALETIIENPKALYDGSWSEWGILE